MNVSVNWVSALLGREIEPAEAAERLAMLCAPVDAVTPVHPELAEIVVGQVESVEQHPNADRLTVCRVNDGDDVLDVVCGAPNVVAGQKYPYARVGTVLPGGLKLARRKIRGVVSNGMLCSESELELGPDRDGIMDLQTDAVPGTGLLEALDLQDTMLELDVTPNRPDLLCHKGVARELGAVDGLPVKLEPIPGAPEPSHTARRFPTSGTVDGIDVSIEDVEGCPRYMAAVIRGVRIGPSPAWLQARLRSVGARPINNVVDATNFLLFEVNQPLHAFDLQALRGGKIVVRRPKPGERIVTLDGETRELNADMTMICDGEGPTAVGGVMGGAASEVTPDTTDLVLECAYFDPKRIRQTRTALKLSTEASYRFERGTDRDAMPDVVRRAVALIRAVAGGTEPEPPVDVYPQPVKARSVFVRPDRVAHVLGMPIPASEVEQYLSSVGFMVAPKNGRLAVQVPGWRPDVTQEVDLIEEVARLKGYESFSAEIRPGRPSSVPDDPVEPLKARVRQLLTAMGLNEARSSPFVAAGSDAAQAIVNPMSIEESHLRENLLPTLIRAVQRNWAVRERNIRLFEIGTVFRRTSEGECPAESLRLAAVITGARSPIHWTAGGASPDYDDWDLKRMFEEGARMAGPAGTLVTTADGWAWHDGAGLRRGWAGHLTADAPAWAAPLLGFEVDLVVGAAAPVTYQPLPATPPIERDLALVVPDGVEAQAVAEVLCQAAGALLEQAVVFDEYRSAELAGRSVAWRLVFRAPDRTLQDKEVDRSIARILKQLKERLHVERRET